MIPPALGMNLSAITHITPLTFNFSTDPNVIVKTIFNTSAVQTNNLMGYFIVLLLMFICYLMLADKTSFGTFGYSDARAISIALAISTIIILTEMQSGFINNFLAVSLSAFLFLISLILILIFENKE